MRVLGAMSGTSGDGIDLALVAFSGTPDQPQHEVLAAETVAYTALWPEWLREAEVCSGERLAELHAAYGAYTGAAARAFLERHALRADVLAMHGHTIFHRPDRGFTFQLGSGAAAAVAAGLVTVSDFRSTDVAHGGQGAPLVPIGDRLLFRQAAVCLNLGGFANVSYETPQGRVAYDVCAVNYVMNRLAARAGLVYDAGGQLAAAGKLLPEVLAHLQALPYFAQAPPKSLGREWVEAELMLLLPDTLAVNDLLHTFAEHAAMQLAAACRDRGPVLISGGGAHNTWLLNRCRALGLTEQVVPDAQTVDFKEAVIFALLGWLRLQVRPNALHSVTGARRDSCGGAIYIP